MESVVQVKATLSFCDGEAFFNYRNEDGTELCKALSPEALRAAFSRQSVDTGWLAPGVTRWGQDGFGDWFCGLYPATIRDISVELAGEISTMTIPIPPIFVMGHFSQWRFLALDDEFSQYSRLFKMPFPNTYEDGSLCWGPSNRAPKVRPENISQAVDLFFTLPFNNHLSTGKCKSYKGDGLKLIAALSKKKPKLFPASELIPTPWNANTYVGYIVRQASVPTYPVVAYDTRLDLVMAEAAEEIEDDEEYEEEVDENHDAQPY